MFDNDRASQVGLSGTQIQRRFNGSLNGRYEDQKTIVKVDFPDCYPFRHLSFDEAGCVRATWQWRNTVTSAAGGIEDPTPKRFMVVDTETTALDGEVIELSCALVDAYFGEDGKCTGFGNVEVYTGRREPSEPIADSAFRVHRISNKDVAGKKLDTGKIVEMLSDVDMFVVAHNAEFDRPKLEAIIPEFAGVKWACSKTGIKWSERYGEHSTSQEMLAYHAGFYYDVHGAESDARALVHLLWVCAKQFDDLVEDAGKEYCRVLATNTPYNSNRLVRQAGYKWSSEPKGWYKDVSDNDLKDELEYLRSKVYDSMTLKATVSRFSAQDRFVSRAFDNPETMYVKKEFSL